MVWLQSEPPRSCNRDRLTKTEGLICGRCVAQPRHRSISADRRIGRNTRTLLRPRARTCDGQPDALFSFDVEYRLRRVRRAPRDVRDAAQSDDAGVRDEIDGDVPLGLERTRDADENLLISGLHHALRRDRVLGVECGDQRGAVDPEGRQQFGRELYIDALVLGPSTSIFEMSGTSRSCFRASST